MSPEPWPITRLLRDLSATKGSSPEHPVKSTGPIGVVGYLMCRLKCHSSHNLIIHSSVKLHSDFRWISSLSPFSRRLNNTQSLCSFPFSPPLWIQCHHCLVFHVSLDLPLLIVHALSGILPPCVKETYQQSSAQEFGKFLAVAIRVHANGILSMLGKQMKDGVILPDGLPFVSGGHYPQ